MCSGSQFSLTDPQLLSEIQTIILLVEGILFCGRHVVVIV